MNDPSGSGGDGDGAASHVVTAFLRHRGDVLLLRRSDAVGTYAGRWGGVSGFAEGDPDEQVRVEIREETGLEPGETVSFVRSGRPVEFEDPDLGREWVVHPYLFESETPEVELSEEHDAAEWVSPTAMLDLEGEMGAVGGGDLEDRGESESERKTDDERATALETAIDDRETVPELWTAYERVAPTVRSIAADDDHGAAWLSIRALEVLRDRAGLLVAERADFGADPDDERDELAELARRLLEARPSMAVLRNRINRAMAGASDGSEGDAGDPAESSDSAGADAGAPAVLESTLTTLERALEADDDAAETASERVEGSVMTLSRSGTVLAALRGGDPSRVFVAESRPAREGVAVAEQLADADDVDCPVTVHTDAAAAHLLSREEIDRVLVGADTVRADGAVVNKTGTRALALAAAREGVPVSVVAATDKVSTREEVNLESGDRSAVYDGDAPLDVMNPTFDVTPADCIDGFVTERGALETDDIGAVVEELRALEDW